MAEKISKKLGEKLSEKERNTVENLFNFTEKLEQFYSNSVCNAEQRESIAKKELNITYLVEQIVKIKNKHISNEEKKNAMHELLEKTDIDYILEEVKEEMDRVSKLMIEKAREASQELQKEFGTLEVSFNKLIDGNIENEEEKLEEANDKKKKILDSEKSKAEEENKMIEYEGNGFWNKFHKIRAQGKDETGKKTGVFKSLIGAVKEYHAESKAFREKMKEEALENEPEEVVRIEKEIKAVEDQMKSSKDNIKKLKEQKKELKYQLMEACERAMEEAKGRLDKSKKPILEEEITEERIGGLFERISAFRENRREAKHERKVNKLKDKIGDITEEINSASTELKYLRDIRDKEGDSKDLKKDMDYDRKFIEKKQKQRFNLAKKVEKENEKYASRNSGMDR